jgi:N-methylhydantoinase A
VTDALVVLGYIDPENFLGGDMKLDRDAAIAACGAVGAPLGLDGEAAAWGIREIALAEMTKAVRTRLAMRGLDPREHALVSYGGCASLFTADIAAALSAPRVIVPLAASVLSALGAATMGMRRERVHSVLKTMPVDPGELRRLSSELTAQVTADLEADGVPAADRAVALEADLRFLRQNWELTIPLDDIAFDESFAEVLVERFAREYAQRYGAGSITLGTPVEIVAVRAVGTGPSEAIGPVTQENDAGAGKEISTSRKREVRAGADAEARIEVGILEYDAIRASQAIRGPALIERWDTSIWVPEGMLARRDGAGSIIVEVT